MNNIERNTRFNEYSSLSCIAVFLLFAPYFFKNSNAKDFLKPKITNEKIIPVLKATLPPVDSMKIDSFKPRAYIRGGPDDPNFYTSYPKIAGGKICIYVFSLLIADGKIIEKKLFYHTCGQDSFPFVFKKGDYRKVPLWGFHYYFYDNKGEPFCEKLVISQ